MGSYFFAENLDFLPRFYYRLPKLPKFSRSAAYWISTQIVQHLKKGSLIEIAGRAYITAYKTYKVKQKETSIAMWIPLRFISRCKMCMAQAKKKVEGDDLPF
jgi:hypothetical protein